MDTNWFDFLKQTYGYEGWVGRNRLAESLFIWKYILGVNDLPGWRPERIQALPPPPQAPLPKTVPSPGAPAAGWIRAIQSIWSPPGSGEALLNLDIYECASRQAAHAVLARLLGEFQSPLGSLQEQTAVGDVAFADSRQATVLFARANLVFFLRNAGRDLLPAGEPATSFDQELVRKPEAAGERAAPQIRHFQAAEKGVRVGRAVRLGVEAVGPAAQPVWHKLFAPSGEIRVEQEQLVYVPSEGGSQEITIYALGPDRRAARQTLQLAVE